MLCDYIRLPWDIFELMKEPSEHSERIMELFNGSLPGKSEETLTFQVAAKLARDLREFPKEKIRAVAVDIIGLSRDTAFQIIEMVKTYPVLYIHTFKYVSNNIHITLNVYKFNTLITLSMC